MRSQRCSLHPELKGTKVWNADDTGRAGEGGHKHINEASAPKVSWKRDMVERWREGRRDG